MTERFSIVIFDAEGYWHRVTDGMTAKEAVEWAKGIIDSAVRRNDPDVAKVIITDEDDFTVFHWERGKGVVFPPLGERPSGDAAASG